MGRFSLTVTNLRRLVELTDPARIDEQGRPLPWSVLRGMADVIGCDAVCYESRDLRTHTVINRQATFKPSPRGDTASNGRSFWSQYWYGCWDDWPPDGDYPVAHRTMPEQSSTDRPVYAEFFQTISGSSEVVIRLPVESGLEHRLLLWRWSGQDFSERDCLVLTLLQPRLAALNRAIYRREPGRVDLTPRQWELMRLIAAGNTNRQIASQLVLSEGTVRTHCEHIFKRLQVTNRVEAIARAFPVGAVPPQFGR